jgi:putative oxidoreductase
MNTFHHLRHSSNNVNLALLIARIAIAALMLSHGIPKLAMFNDSPVKFIEFMGLSAEISLALVIFAEVVCSVLLLIGLATRYATVPLIITMLVAVLQVHASDPFSSKEPGIHYLLVYVMLLLMGAGKYSVDHVLNKRNR